MAPAPDRQVLRGATLVSAPFTFVGVVAAAFTITTVLWMVADDRQIGVWAWVTLAVAAAISIAGFLGARGCKVAVADGEVRDIVAWRTMHRVRCSDVEAVRVRRGPWRTYEMETADGTRRVVLGAGPVQFPSYLLPGASERDLHAIDVMVGDLPT